MPSITSLSQRGKLCNNINYNTTWKLSSIIFQGGHKYSNSQVLQIILKFNMLHSFNHCFIHLCNCVCVRVHQRIYRSYTHARIQICEKSQKTKCVCVLVTWHFMPSQPLRLYQGDIYMCLCVCVTWCFMPSQPLWLYQGDMCVCVCISNLVFYAQSTIAVISGQYVCVYVLVFYT